MSATIHPHPSVLHSQAQILAFQLRHRMRIVLGENGKAIAVPTICRANEIAMHMSQGTGDWDGGAAA